MAIALTSFVYLLFCVVAGCTTRRDVTCKIFR